MKILYISIVNTILSSSVFANTVGEVVSSNINDYELQPWKCNTSYKQISRSDAERHRYSLTDRMGKYQITSIGEGYNILGKGHNSVIKPGPQRAMSWCKRHKSEDFLLPTYPALFIPENNFQQVEWELVNTPAFYKPLSLVAHYMGYGWVSGKNSSYVGGDMVMSINSQGSYNIDGNTQGSCEEKDQRCDERIEIGIDNIEYMIDGDTLKTGDISVSDERHVKDIYRTLRNYNSLPQTHRITYTVTKSTNWSKTESHSISEKVSVKNAIKWPLDKGSTEVTVELGSEQRWSDTNGGSESNTVSDTAVVTVPPFTELDIYINISEATISYPYSFDAEVSYDVSFFNFLRYSGNALKEHPTNRPDQRADFTLGRYTEPKTNLLYQFENQNIPNPDIIWDWDWVSKTYGLSFSKSFIARMTRPVYTTISGHFSADNASVGSIEFGRERPLTSSEPEGIEMRSEEVINELKTYGIEDLTIAVTPI